VRHAARLVVAEDFTMIWIAGRNREQGELVAEAFQAAEGVPRERSAVIAGGLPGAAKDTARQPEGR
jgi:hypothetical protein